MACSGFLIILEQQSVTQTSNANASFPQFPRTVYPFADPLPHPKQTLLLTVNEKFHANETSHRKR